MKDLYQVTPVNNILITASAGSVTAPYGHNRLISQRWSIN